MQPLDRVTQLQQRRLAREARRRPAAAGVSPPRAAASLSPNESSAMTDDDLIYDIPRTKIITLITDIESAKQRQSDANTAHMSEWKAAKESGAPVDALKICMRLDRMASDKRRDILRGFDELRAKYYTHWADQPDMFDEDRDEDSASAESEEAPTTQDRDDEPAPLAAQDNTEPSEAPAADWGDDKAVEGGATGAVAAFNAGKEAGLGGEAAESNPHSGRSAPGRSWRKGWEAGRTESQAEWLAATNEGAEARREGLSRTDNPYPPGSRKKGWDDGWETEGERHLSMGANVVHLGAVDGGPLNQTAAQ